MDRKIFFQFEIGKNFIDQNEIFPMQSEFSKSLLFESN